jgi:hypothetical protein
MGITIITARGERMNIQEWADYIGQLHQTWVKLKCVTDDPNERELLFDQARRKTDSQLIRDIQQLQKSA